MVIMVVEFAIVKKDGKVLNVIYHKENVRNLIVQTMVIALMVNAVVREVGKDHFVNNVSIEQ